MGSSCWARRRPLHSGGPRKLDNKEGRAVEFLFVLASVVFPSFTNPSTSSIVSMYATGHALHVSSGLHDA